MMEANTHLKNIDGALALLTFQTNQDPTPENISFFLEGYSKEELMTAYATLWSAVLSSLNLEHLIHNSSFWNHIIKVLEHNRD